MRTNRVSLVGLLVLSGCIGAGVDGEDAESSEQNLGVLWDDPSVGPTGRWPGQNEFESAGPWTHVWGPMFKSAAGAAPESADASRAIEESDIVKVVGNTLYALNPYRGLLIIDITTVDSPKIKGRLNILGTPQEMYVRGSTAYVLLNDYYTFSAGQEYGAKVLVVDLSSKKKPVVESEFSITGFVSDSRLVGDALYVVSTDYNYGPDSSEVTTHIRSLNIADASDVVEVDDVTFPGDGNLIHVTEENIFVAKYAYPNMNVQAVDISDPQGAMVVGGELAVEGMIQDRFMMDYADGTLRVVGHSWDDGGHIFVQTAALQNGAFSPLGKLDLGGIGQLTAARFDGERVYLVHQVRVDPLDVVDLSNPSTPVLVDRIEIPGWLEHLEVRDGRIIGIGFDQAGTPAPAKLCPGTVYEPLTEGRQLSVALYDVSAAGLVCEGARVRFGTGDWAWSGAFYDDKALKYLSDDNLLLVPFSSWDEAGNHNAVQLIDVQLDTMQLAVRGTVPNASQVDRSFVAKNRLMAMGMRELTVANIADRDAPVVTRKLELARNVTAFAPAGPKGYGVQLVSGDWNENAELRVVQLATPDAEQADAVGFVPVDAPAGDLFVDGDIVTVVSRIYDEQGQRARISNFDLFDPSNPEKIGEIELPVGYGHNMHPMNRMRYLPTQDVVRVRPDLFVVSAPYEAGMKYSVVSIANPWNPETVFEHEKPSDKTVVMDLKTWWNDLYVVSYTPLEVETPAIEGEFAVVDPVPAAEGSPDGVAAKMMPYYAPTQERVQYHVTRVTFANDGTPTLGKAINVPGRLVDVSSDGKIWTLLDTRWNDNSDGTQEKAMFSVKLNKKQTKATLLDGLNVESGVDDITVRKGAAYYTVMWPDWSGPVVQVNELGEVVQPANPELKLVVVAYGNPAAIHEASRTTVSDDGSYGTLLDVREAGGDRFAFISTGWGGLAVFDVTKKNSPTLFDFVRSNAGYSSIVVDAASKTAFAAGQYYGVEKISLK